MIDDRVSCGLSRDIGQRPSQLVKHRTKNPKEIDLLLSKPGKLHLRFALAIVARVMGDYDEVYAMQLKELLQPLAAINRQCAEFLSAHGLHFGSAADALNSKFRLGPRPTVEVVDQGHLFEIVLQDAMEWNWLFDDEGPRIFWTLRLNTKEALTLGNGKGHIVFVRQPEGLSLLSNDFSLPTVQKLGGTSRESIGETDKVVPIKMQAIAQIKACYEALLDSIKSGKIDLEKTRNIASFLAPVRTMKIQALPSSNGDIERLSILYYSLALFLDQVRMILADPTFSEKKVSEHLVHLAELMQSCHDQALKSWCHGLLECQRKFLQGESAWPTLTEAAEIDFLNLNDIMKMLNHLRVQVKGTSPRRNILATAEIMEIIRSKNRSMSFGRAMRKYASMIPLWHALGAGNPRTLRELGLQAKLTEKTAWKHISTLREWGALPANAYTHLGKTKAE